MKKKIQIWTCTAFYLWGVLTSRTLLCLWGGFYPLYNWFMCKSVELNDKHDLKVWSDKK